MEQLVGTGKVNVLRENSLQLGLHFRQLHTYNACTSMFSFRVLFITKSKPDAVQFVTDS